MKNVMTSINDLQIACFNLKPGFLQLAEARKNLINSILNVIIESGASQEYIDKFNKAVNIG